MPTTVYEHDAATRRFERMLSRGRLASTFLFVGPSGIGKRAFAMRLAEALLCTGNPGSTLQACGQCESCRLLDAGTHPDLLQICLPKGKSALPVELFIGDREHRNQRGMCHEISLKPYLGTRRVAVIDDADCLTTESANCLLKTLEEPPPRSVIILIGVALGRQLPTIRSRCQVIRFPLLSEETVERILREKNLVESHEDCRQLASAGEGSVAQALAARDEQASVFQATFTGQLANEGFDPVRLAAETTAFISEAGAEPSLRRNRLAGLISGVIQYYRDRMTQPHVSGAAAQGAVDCLTVCLDAESALKRNANQATLIQNWLSELWRAHQQWRPANSV